MIKRRKEDIIVIILALIMVGVILGIALVVLWEPKKAPEQRRIGTAPTAYPTKSSPTREPTSEPEFVPYKGSSTVLYNATDADTLVDLAENRRELSVQDIQAKDKLLESLFAVAPSGYVYTSTTIRIEYVNSADQFVGEITTIQVDAAKKEAVDWFISQGFTKEGLCRMPIQFYLNYDIVTSLEGTPVTFSPLVPGCN